jgi:hypothetical protein
MRMIMVGHVARMGERRNAYRILVVKIDLREIGWNSMDCIDLAQDKDQWNALVNTVLNLRVP